ncbi:MAG: hypothetical protein GQ538_00445 [Xanthomonadales bacterium]|nr:hypothetical protein [Xanthomonadales bacterium]
MKSSWQLIYAIVSVAVLVAILIDQPSLYMIVKPLLMVSLLFYFIAASKGYPKWRVLVMLALVFSWLGDVLLLSDDLFMAGLAAFLIAHIFYISAYHKTGAASGELRPLDIIKLVVLGAILVSILFPHLGGLLIPVLVYATVLLGMALWAHKRRGATSATSFMLVSIGAILFVISDSVIAVNKFAFEVPGERLLVMSTYITSQYLIIRGLLEHESV